MAIMQVYAYSCIVSDRASYRNVFLKKSYSFSCLRDTFQDKSIPFPLQCTFAFLPYAPRKMLIQQLCNKDHVMRTILCNKGRVPQ